MDKDQTDFLSEAVAEEQTAPLADKLRPKTLEELRGQGKLVAPDSLLSKMISSGEYHSFILWGPPGTGKTTIARIIERASGHRFIQFSAVLSSIRDVKAVMKDAQYAHRHRNERTIIFIDEIHRFNKAQQDAFLPYVESGSVILIGARGHPGASLALPCLRAGNAFRRGSSGHHLQRLQGA